MAAMRPSAIAMSMPALDRAAVRDPRVPQYEIERHVVSPFAQYRTSNSRHISLLDAWLQDHSLGGGARLRLSTRAYRRTVAGA